MLRCRAAEHRKSKLTLFGIRKPGRGETLQITLPVVFTRDTLYALVGALTLGLRRRPQKVALDFSKLERIQVGGITMLSNMIEMYSQFGIKTVYRDIDKCKAKTFLQGSGFLSQYVGTKAELGARKTFLPLQLVEYDRSHVYLHDHIVPWLAGVLGMNVRELSSLKVSLEEIFNNIRDHSSVHVGCSAAHYDASNDTITVCISDFGIGIPGRVRNAIEIGSDHAAIAMACQEGFTTKTSPRNRGAGLYVLIRNVVQRNRGSVIISSGNGIYSCVHQPGKPNKGTGRTAPGQYPGTVIYITLKKSEFVPSELDGEEFEWE
jgi:anti-sigma regulatory factor (Ser/Thr protein kinase)